MKLSVTNRILVVETVKITYKIPLVQIKDITYVEKQQIVILTTDADFVNGEFKIPYQYVEQPLYSSWALFKEWFSNNINADNYDSTKYTLRYHYDSDELISYSGFAIVGSSEDDEVWTITKIETNADGEVTKITREQNKKWSEIIN